MTGAFGISEERWEAMIEEVAAVAQDNRDREEREREMSSYDKGLLSDRFDRARFEVYSRIDTYDKAIEFLRDTIDDLEKWRKQ